MLKDQNDASLKILDCHLSYPNKLYTCAKFHCHRSILMTFRRRLKCSRIEFQVLTHDLTLMRSSFLLGLGSETVNIHVLVMFTVTLEAECLASTILALHVIFCEHGSERTRFHFVIMTTISFTGAKLWNDKLFPQTLKRQNQLIHLRKS